MVGLALGRGGRAGHRVLGDGGEGARAGVLDPRRCGLDPVSLITRTRSRSRRRSAPSFARVWMHNGMLALGGEDMHKSLGNDVSLRNVLDTWGREATLVFFLTGHWHGPIDFSDEAMKSARARADGFREVFRDARAGPGRGLGTASRRRWRTTSTPPRLSP